MDREDAGVKDAWFSRDLTDRIKLPGILQSQGYGDEISVETPWVAALPRDMKWYLLPQYKAYTTPGHVEMPYLSQPVKHYLGVAWYQRDIVVPAGWAAKRVGLTLERTRWETTVFVDERKVGSCHSLVAPHEYDLGMLTPGRHRLSVRIDNRMILPYRPDGHSVSDAEGGTWQGVVGKIELTATSPVWIADAQVYPDVAKKTARVKVTIGNAGGKAGSGTLASGGVKVPVSWTAEGGAAEIEVPLGPKAVAWSEFSPVLQKLTVTLNGTDADDRREVTFGLREITRSGKKILLNGEEFHFRSTHDGGGFPLTGYPATDVAAWKKIIGICKEWGLNGIRFHSWCPPEAAFTAADELGFYLQPECGMWNSFDPEGKMLAVLNDETARMLKAYGNHPSFVLLAATNEPAGHYQEQLPVWDKKWHDADSRRLYADGTGRPAMPVAGKGWPADFVISSRNGRGPKGWFGADYEAGIGEIDAPVIGHEVGQWCAYPDFDVMKKFTGYLRPGNFVIMKDSAAATGVLAKNKQFAHASGRFQVACYKEEIEASLRTPSYSGYELLDLHDYLGQGGALIGMLDAFWEDKGYTNAAEFRQFCNTTVPLARLKDRVYSTADELHAEVEVAHYGPVPLKGAAAAWRIMDAGGKVMARGEWAAKDVPRGKNIPVGKVSAKLAGLPAPAVYRLEVELGSAGKAFKNEWNFWVYPAQGEAAVPGDVLVTSAWPEAETRLAAGGKVLFLPVAADLDSTDLKLSTVPTFWNRLMNPSGAWMLGLLNEAKHPALAGFPTEASCDWQWVDLLGGARALNMATMPRALEPIVQPIDDWNRNTKLGMMLECTVGTGRLFVSLFDLHGGKVDARPGAVALRKSVLEYMAGDKFRPAIDVPVEDMRKQWVSLRKGYVDPGAEKPDVPSSPDLVAPGEIRRKPGA